MCFAAIIKILSIELSVSQISEPTFWNAASACTCLVTGSQEAVHEQAILE